MTHTWRKRSAGCCRRGKRRAAVEHAAQKVTSDHGNILPLSRRDFDRMIRTPGMLIFTSVTCWYGPAMGDDRSRRGKDTKRTELHAKECKSLIYKGLGLFHELGYVCPFTHS